MNEIKKSLIRQFAEKAKPGSINLGLGQLEFPLPEEVKAAGIKAFQEGFTKYSPNAGFLELRQAIAEDANVSRKTNYTSENIVVNAGVEQALFATLFCTINSGDKVVIPEPAYPAYAAILAMLGAKVVNLPLTETFELDLQKTEEATKGAKAIILNFPTNPTGQIMSKKHAEELTKIAEKNKCLIITDEIYFNLYYEEMSVSPATFSQNAIILDGISKRASATGLRIGWTIAPKELVPSLEAANQYMLTCATSVSQKAALAAVTKNDFEAGFRKELKKQRDAMYDEFQKWGVGKGIKPKGAFYFFPDLSELGSSLELAEKIIANGVTVIPGDAFGPSGKGHIRLSFAAPEKKIGEAMKIIREVIV